MNIVKCIAIILVLFTLYSCKEKKEQTHYENQIGDTPFDHNLDNANFKFCDSTDVLHKRAFVYYNGGPRGLKTELIKKMKTYPKNSSFNGFFLIRFAVNCHDEAGRFRMETYDGQFKEITAPNELDKQVLTIMKSLRGWNHAIYQGKDYDGYKFINIKIVNGQIDEI